jgi:hypothetical protein
VIEISAYSIVCLISSLLVADSFALDRRHWSAGINLALSRDELISLTPVQRARIDAQGSRSAF